MRTNHRSNPLVRYRNHGMEENMRRFWRYSFALIAAVLACAGAQWPGGNVWSQDLEGIRTAGKLRHLGIPYARFVTGKGSGLDEDIMRGFAEYLGVEYEFVETTWGKIITDLTGKDVKPRGAEVDVVGEGMVRGDVIATGFTVLPWRTRVVDFSTPTFPTGVWILARGDSPLQPVTPTGDIQKDINAVKAVLKDHTVLGLEGSCLDPDLYGMTGAEIEIKMFPGDRDLNDMIPAVMAGVADTTLMDVPVALVALEQYPGEIKVLGPVSPQQAMACAFRQDSPKLREAFEAYFAGIKMDGTYRQLVRKYYPSVFTYYGDFFAD